MAPARVAIIGAPLDLGAGRRGVDMGPSAIRYAGLRDRLVDAGIDVEDHGNVQAPLAETHSGGSEKARFLDEILETCARVGQEVEAARADGLFPLVLGGDHSIAIGTLSGLAVEGTGGVLWIDAHGDLNTPDTTPSGNVHGMPLAAALGRCGTLFSANGLRLPAIDAARVALVGVRSLDPGEQALVRELGISVYTISDLDRRGVEPVIDEALGRVSGGAFVHVSVDLDAVDPEFAPGVGDPLLGGLSYREAHLALELVAEAGVLDALELVEVNPIRDHENTTAKLAVGLAASALGVRIL
ncbi:MAG: arginase [Actinomycetota bacterium]